MKQKNKKKIHTISRRLQINPDTSRFLNLKLNIATKERAVHCLETTQSRLLANKDINSVVWNLFWIGSDCKSLQANATCCCDGSVQTNDM